MFCFVLISFVVVVVCFYFAVATAAIKIVGRFVLKTKKKLRKKVKEDVYHCKKNQLQPHRSEAEEDESYFTRVTKLNLYLIFSLSRFLCFLIYHHSFQCGKRHQQI